MCGRFALDLDVTKLKEEFPWLELPDDLASSFNIAPSQRVAVVTNSGKPEVELYHWGLVPFWAKDTSIANKLINARAETLSEKPSFRHAFRQQRCVIFSSGYFEWMKAEDGSKQPVFITLKDSHYFVFAGLWEKWIDKSVNDPEPFFSCTIITTRANNFLRKYHHRMPVILNPNGIYRWLDSGTTDTESLADLLVPYKNDAFKIYSVSKAVNNPRNNSSELIEPQGQLF